MLIRKHQYCNSQASIVGVGNGDKFPDFVDLLFIFFGIKNVSVFGKIIRVDRKRTYKYICLALY